MTSLTDLREVVDVVIGVDTDVNTHSAAVLDTATGGVLDEITVDATAQGYAELVKFANNHARLRAWAIEGTGGHGAGLSRHLIEISEIVIELDRPKRAARRNGAKSDPLDAIRAAREAMARPQLGTPRTGGERQALSVLLAARRSAINASTEAQQQVFSLVIAAPEPIRARFRGQKLAAMLNTAANLRVHASYDPETTSTVVAVRTLARRAHAMLKETRELQKAILTIIRSWRPDLLGEFGVSDQSSQRRCYAPGPTPAASTPRPRSRCSRRRTHPGEQRPSHHPLLAQPLRRPPAQQRTAHRGAEPNPVPASHPRQHDDATRGHGIALRTTSREPARPIGSFRATRSDCQVAHVQRRWAAGCFGADSARGPIARPRAESPMRHKLFYVMTSGHGPYGNVTLSGTEYA